VTVIQIVKLDVGRNDDVHPDEMGFDRMRIEVHSLDTQKMTMIRCFKVSVADMIPRIDVADEIGWRFKVVFEDLACGTMDDEKGVILMGSDLIL